MERAEIQMSLELPVPPQRIYQAWLNSSEHGGFTGSKAEIHPEIGSHYTAWEGYIFGKIVDLEEGRRILHTWRTDEFGEGDDDSLLEIRLEPISVGARLVLKHWNIPAQLKEGYAEGWEEYYFKPMREYFSAW